MIMDLRGQSEDLWRTGMQFLAAKECKNTLGTSGPRPAPINYAARRKASSVAMGMMQFLAEKGPANTVEIAAALGMPSQTVANRTGNLRGRGIAITIGSVKVKSGGSTVIARIWDVGPNYQDWLKAQEEVQ